MVQQPGRALFNARRIILLSALLAAAGISTITAPAFAQNFTCFPSCDANDARMLSVASTGLNTLSGQDVQLTIASPASSPVISIGVFDGETGKLSGGASHWDIGTVPLMYTLFADPNADGTGTFQVAEWSGDSMPDNDWFSATLNNVVQAQTGSGAYYYLLRVRTTNAATTHWSNFKIRTSGAIVIRPGQAFSLSAPLPDLATAQIVYPLFPTATPTTYDGNWTFYLNVPVEMSTLELWDGDLDYGDFACASVDEDDDDTPNLTVPVWAPAGTSAVIEGVAHSAILCANGDTATSNPTDDSQSALLRRSPNIFYEVIDPNGESYVNANPSGNLEWEQFLISTDPFDRDKMDYHADSLPPGIYTLNIYGMDLQNLDAFRFPPGTVAAGPTLLGVDTAGSPVVPPSPVPPAVGVIGGNVFFDGNSNGVLDASEGRVAGVPVTVSIDVNGDFVVDVTRTGSTDVNGHYQFSQLPNGAATVRLDSTQISANAVPTVDPDGIATRHRAVLNLTTASHTFNNAHFGYHENISATIAGDDTLMASTNSTYTSTASEAGVTYSWTITGSANIVGATNGPTVNIHTNVFGTFKLKLTITKNGSTFSVTKNVAVIGVDFAVFGYQKVTLTGRCGNDVSRGRFNGNVGVNLPVVGCNQRPNMLVGQSSGCGGNHPAFFGDGTRLMGDYVDLEAGVSVWDLYANRTSGSTGSATKRHAGPLSFSAPIYSPSTLPVVPNFTYNSSNYTVSTNQTRTLAPGRYGVVTVNSGGVLNLQNGIYNIKSLRGYNNVTINTQAGTKVRIASDMKFGSGGYVGPENGALFIVRSDGNCSDNVSVDFGTSIEFHGQVLVPTGEMDLGTSSDLVGRFWALRITAGCDVNVTYWGPVDYLTHNNNDGFQKKLLGQAVTGGVNSAMMNHAYPNPFNASTAVTLNPTTESTVTLKVVDASGNQVRTLLENSIVPQGETQVTWDGTGYAGEMLPSGNYFFYLVVGDHVETQPIVLTR